ncbi:MAG: apolipoprotein N-acyltransferase [Nitrospirae bacterium]|nr:apolipoprotein N-acyltransferase [Nitrospirota bacterium]
MNLRGYKIYLLAVLSGTALVFAFPKFDLYAVSWFCLSPFLLSLNRMSNKEAFRAGIFFGIPYFFGTEYWIYHSINHYGGIPFIPSLALVLLLSLYQSLYTGIFGLLFSLKIKNTRLPAMLLAPLMWVSLEFVRSYALTGFPWSSIGYSQYKLIPLIQFVDITGIYGVSFLLMAVNGAIADIFILKERKDKMPLFSTMPTIAGYGALISITLMAVLYGYLRLNELPTGVTFRASIIQGNIPQELKWSPEYQRDVIETYKDMTLSANSLSPSLIVWPESAVPFYFMNDPTLTEELIEFQRSLDTYLLFGAITIKAVSKDAPPELSNSAILLNRLSEVGYVYDKIHLVPFGEYVPLRRMLFFVDKLVAGIGDYTRGDRYIKAEAPFGRFGTLICYEIIFPGLVRKFYTKDGDFIVTITNDAWFGDTGGPYQHWSMAVFRAIENRKPLIRAANTGISGFIDSNGRILKMTPIFERRILTPSGARGY